MKRVIILGGGRSVTEGLQSNLWSRIRKEEIWSLNFAYKFIPYLPDRQLWVDRSMFKNNNREIQIMYHEGVELYTQPNELYENYKDVKINILSTFKERTTFDEKFKNNIFVGRFGLVGLYALSLAVKENYDEIYLLGYDFGTTAITDKNTHWYQEKVIEKNISSTGVGNPRVYLESNNQIKSSVADFDVFTVFPNKIYNVSLTSNISAFPKMSYIDFYQKLRGN